jgi:shikimate dehydrogenase
MKKYGLIGYPLTHSFSQKYFTEKFEKENVMDCSYANYSLENISQLTDILSNDENLVGLNVTIPYKEQVLSFLDEIDADAEKIGAVNTIKILRNQGKVNLKGYNSDVYGFRKPLEEVLKPAIQTSALILGTGGASKAVAWVLNSLGISYHFVSRTPKSENDYAYSDLTPEIIEYNKIIVNTSPIGMYPNVNSQPDIPYTGLTKNHILYDLIYNPERTGFLQKGHEKKATLINGLPMLYLQAEKSWEIWNA